MDAKFSSYSSLLSEDTELKDEDSELIEDSEELSSSEPLDWGLEPEEGVSGNSMLFFVSISALLSFLSFLLLDRSTAGTRMATKPTGTSTEMAMIPPVNVLI